MHPAGERLCGSCRRGSLPPLPLPGGRPSWNRLKGFAPLPAPCCCCCCCHCCCWRCWYCCRWPPLLPGASSKAEMRGMRKCCLDAPLPLPGGLLMPLAAAAICRMSRTVRLPVLGGAPAAAADAAPSPAPAGCWWRGTSQAPTWRAPAICRVRRTAAAEAGGTSYRISGRQAGRPAGRGQQLSQARMQAVAPFQTGIQQQQVQKANGAAPTCQGELQVAVVLVSATWRPHLLLLLPA